MTLPYSYTSKPKVVRRTFFSFHYQVDVTRAHVVKNSWVTKEEREDAGFFDASVFESKKRAGDDSCQQKRIGMDLPVLPPEIENHKDREKGPE